MTSIRTLATPALLTLATRFPTRRVGPWRHVLGLCFAVITALVFTHAVFITLFASTYPSFTTPHPINTLLFLLANVTMVLSNVAVLVAWREEAEQQFAERRAELMRQVEQLQSQGATHG